MKPFVDELILFAHYRRGIAERGQQDSNVRLIDTPGFVRRWSGARAITEDTGTPHKESVQPPVCSGDQDALPPLQTLCDLFLRNRPFTDHLPIRLRDGWDQTFGYDGFGNLVSKTGTNSPPLSIAVTASNNHVVGQTYDLNGNQMTGNGITTGTMVYDAENRIQSVNDVRYAYDSHNKRIWKGVYDLSGNMTSQEIYFYGADRQKLGTYPVSVYQPGPSYLPRLTDSNSETAIFFGGKRVGVNGSAFVADRLGSKGKYFPYGEDRGTPLANDQVKFATYTRDSALGWIMRTSGTIKIILGGL